MNTSTGNYNRLGLAAYITIMANADHPEWTAEDVSRHYATATGFTYNIKKYFNEYVDTLSEQDKIEIEKAVDREFHRTTTTTNKSKDTEGGTDRFIWLYRFLSCGPQLCRSEFRFPLVLVLLSGA